MIDILKRTWAAVDLDAVAGNVTAIRNTLRPGCMLMGVVKADAYGHGDYYVSKELAELGTDWFGVSNLVEGMALRDYGLTQPILIFGATPVSQTEQLIQHSITQAVYSHEHALALSREAQRLGLTAKVHVKVDTGMGRLGFVEDGISDEAEHQIAEAYQLPGLEVTGIFTHFACADERSESAVLYTKAQFDRFMKVCRYLEQKGIRPGIRHCCNSGGTLLYPEYQLDMVRPGIILYGLDPSDECRGILPLSPAMSLYTTVSMVKEIKAGTCVSYGRTFTAPKDMTVATVAIGYADGYSRGLSNKARMLVRGQFAPVVGRVCMDQLMLDITGIPQVTEGDVVTIVGQDQGNVLTVDEMAALCDTVNYEKVCVVGRRVPRVYYKNGKEFGAVDYIRPGKTDWSREG